MTRSHHRIPGTRLAVERRSQLLRLAAVGGYLLGPAAAATVLRGRRGDARAAEARWAAKAARLLDIRLDLHGLDRIDPGRRYVVAPLHEGFADAIALLHLPLRMRFVARTELLGWTTLGSALSAGGHVVVDPERPIAAWRGLVRGARALPDSESVVVFPQGTVLGIESAFSAGAFHLASLIDAPLLPVVITGTHRVWEHPFSPVVRFGVRVRVEVLDAVAPADSVDQMRAIEREMKRKALAATPPPRRYVPEDDGWWDGYDFSIDPTFPALAARLREHRLGVAAPD